MPILNSDYNPPVLFYNGHLQTIYPPLFRKITNINYTRKRIFTPDSDFIDLDWSCVGADKAVIISHGLEGHSERKYMQGMIKACNDRGWDGIAFNFRGCSGKPNLLPSFYHSGATEDLHTVVCNVLETGYYNNIALIGFSLGGNLTLKYIGENSSNLSPFIKCGAAVSVPCDLKAGAWKLSHKSNGVYMKRFLLMFHEKIKAKMEIMPGQISDKGYENIYNFMDYDDKYTAPLHGFSCAEDYYAKCSCKQFLPEIKIPTLLISAKNDPFLAKACYPLDEAKNNDYLFLEIPDSGGHVGFIQFNGTGEYWHEKRIGSFINKYAEC